MARRSVHYGRHERERQFNFEALQQKQTTKRRPPKGGRYEGKERHPVKRGRHDGKCNIFLQGYRMLALCGEDLAEADGLH